MGTEATTTANVAPAGRYLEPSEDVVFGTRPSSGRPHSISLHRGPGDRAAAASSRGGAVRGIDVLVGVGLGAAIMYYLDPQAGARRRAQLRDLIVHALAGDAS